MLITGASGKLGKALKEIFPEARTPGHQELDITNRIRVSHYIEKHKPKIIIHTAAFTDVAQAEKEKDIVWGTNVEGTENLVEACLKYSSDAFFVYISTACVFDGQRGEYTEEDVPNPKNFYALTKLVGEFVARRLKNHLIIRTNFVAREKWPYAGAFTDRFGTYLFADDLARAIKDVLDKKIHGLVHVCGEEKISMYDLAKITTPDIKPMTMDEIDLPLTRDMSLRSARIEPYKISIR